jgi:CRISPR-associated endonuclease/helicase Cas3
VDWRKRFGVQMTAELRDELTEWFAARLGVKPPSANGGPRLWERARNQFEAVCARWSDDEVPEDDGLMAVLLQGAVTLADHAASAGVELDTVSPVRSGYIKRMAAPYPHQSAAGEATGHLILISPTGSGKTEAGLAWASSQMDAMPGRPRLVWLLPYRASIDAICDRFGEDFGCGIEGIGVLHATVAATLLDRIACDDRAPGKDDVDKAKAMAGAMRLFKQRVRVATPHQLLRAAIAGPKYSSVLLEQANSVFVLDELHAYDPVTFGRICAAMKLWERLGSRVAVVSATLAEPMISLVRESLSSPVTVVTASPGTAPIRHRLAVDPKPLDAPESLDRIRGWIGEGQSVLVIANRVAVAQRLFNLLAPEAPDSELLHSRFKYKDRASIEKRIKARHPERDADSPALRGGGLVVSTQALEVSLCLDFDRGASEIAPVEAIAQRMGRVNRRGRHPDGAVEFRVHEIDSVKPYPARPYEEGAIEAARLALRGWDGELVSEQTIGQWLSCAYDTDWGRAWAKTARDERDGFAKAFFDFREPFHDRSEHARKLDEKFDTVEVLLHSDVDNYRDLVSGTDGDPLRAAGLLISVSIRQRAILGVRLNEKLGVLVAEERWDTRYDPRTGLDLSDPPEEMSPVL